MNATDLNRSVILGRKSRLNFLLYSWAFIYFLLVTNIACAETVNGAPAIDLIGQYDQTSLADPVPEYSKEQPQDAPNRLGFSYPAHAIIDSVDHRLFVAESGRILIYNLDSNNQLQDWLPDNVLGQANFFSRTTSIGVNVFGSVSAIAYSSSSKLLFVADYSNSRVLVFDCTTIVNGENAVRVLGQADFVTDSNTVNANTLDGPSGLALNTSLNYLYVSDSTNNRVLVFDVATITNGEAAFRVLGQADFISNSSSVSQSSTAFPNALALDQLNNRLFVSQSDANRVTIFDVSTISNGENAVSVIGQPNFTISSSANSATKLNSPQSIAYDSGNQYLYVGSSGRTLVYDVASITDGEGAINVLGENSFTSSSVVGSASGTATPQGLFVDSTNAILYVCDTANNRIVLFDIASLADGEAAITSIGQYDDSSPINPLPILNKTGENNSPSRFGLSFPEGVAVDEVNHKLFIADTSNNRVLGFNLDNNNELQDHIADLVLGQPDFISSGSSVSISGLNGPRALTVDETGQRLFVADTFSRRVLVYDLSLISSGAAATNVLGQPDFTTSLVGTNSSRLGFVQGVAFDPNSNRLFVSDSSNSRVMVFDTATISNGEPAIAVLGQPDFISGTGATTQSGLNSPNQLAVNSSGTRLFVADSGNERVIEYNVESIADGENAVGVLGQTSFTSTNSGGLNTGTSSPRAVAFDEETNTLFVTEGSRHRVLMFDVATLTNGEAAINVLGQPDFSSTGSSVSQTGLQSPRGLAVSDSLRRLFIADSNSNRIVAIPFDYRLSLSGTEFDENISNNGSISTSLTVTLLNDFFSVLSSEFVKDTHYTVSNLPDGLTMSVFVSSPTEATIQLNGNATNNFNSDDVSNLTLNFLDAAFSNVAASSVEGAQNINLSIDFQGSPTPTPTPTPTFVATEIPAMPTQIPSPQPSPTKAPSSSISGSISFVGAQGTEVYVNAGLLGSFLSSSTGNFTLEGLVDGNAYKVTPKKDGLVFSPTSVNITSLSEAIQFTATSENRDTSRCSAKNQSKQRAAIDMQTRSILTRTNSLLELAERNLSSVPAGKIQTIQAKISQLRSALDANYSKYQESSLALPVEWLKCKSTAKCKSIASLAAKNRAIKSLAQLEKNGISSSMFITKSFNSLKKSASQNQNVIRSTRTKVQRKIAGLPESTFQCLAK